MFVIPMFMIVSSVPINHTNHDFIVCARYMHLKVCLTFSPSELKLRTVKNKADGTHWHPREFKPLTNQHRMLQPALNSVQGRSKSNSYLHTM